MLKRLRIFQAYRRFNRYREVLFTLIKYGFEDIVERLGPEFLLRRSLRWKPGQQRDLPTPARLRLALTDLGPTFVKFGQLLSTRPDVLPTEYIEELAKLQDQVPSFPFEEARRIIIEELKNGPHQIFESFEEAPLASGSIAQVHQARLRTGERVAVKVQRPRIRSIIETDLSILQEISELGERHLPEVRLYRPSALVEQFANTIRRELDFVAEAYAAERFRFNFQGDPMFVVPSVFWDFTTERVLTTELIRGIKITDIDAIEARGYDKEIIARNGARAILKEIFEHRLFHGDPHPGNFFVLEGNVIAAVDFGITGRLDEETTERLSEMLSGFIKRDIEKVVRVFRGMELIPDDADRTLLKYDLMEFIDRYHGLPLGRIDAAQVFQDLLRILRRHRIFLPVNLALMGRMLAISAGVGRMLDPRFDLLAEAKPFVESFLLRRYDPRRQLREVSSLFDRYGAMVKAFPSDLEEIVAKLKKGKMLVSLHHEGLNKFILEMDRSSNRISFALIIASLIVGSSMVMQVDKGPMLFGFSVIGLAGYLIAGLLGLWLVTAILRSGKI